MEGFIEIVERDPKEDVDEEHGTSDGSQQQIYFLVVSEGMGIELRFIKIDSDTIAS